MSAGAILAVVLIVNIVKKNARRWRALADIKSDIVSEDFLTLHDLPRVSVLLMEVIESIRTGG